MTSLATAATLLVFLYGLPTTAVAHDDGMDMSMDGSMSLASGTMKPYLHFTPGDVIWFLGWVPQSRGAMVGTCIGLFLLALVDRWLAAIRASAESHWRQRYLLFNSPFLLFRSYQASAQVMQTNRLNALAKDGKHSSNIPRSIPSRLLNTSLLFIPAHDITRGLLHVGQVALGFAFMLVVM